jgi:hypothetical protein
MLRAPMSSNGGFLEAQTLELVGTSHSSNRNTLYPRQDSLDPAQSAFIDLGGVGEKHSSLFNTRKQIYGVRVTSERRLLCLRHNLRKSAD